MEKCKICKASGLNYAKNLSKSDFEELMAHSALITLNRGETIFVENENLKNLFCIQRGICKFSKIDDTGKERISKLLGAGELMGRRSVISNSGAAVSATAITPSVVCSVDKAPFLKSLRSNGKFCFDVLKGFIADSKKDEQALGFLCNHKSITARLAGLLCYLVENFGLEKDGSLVAKLKREDMANILGTSTEYVITKLKKFKEQNFIEVKKRKIYILSLNALRQEAKF